MFRSRYIRGLLLGETAGMLALASVYLTLVAVGNMSFSTLAFCAAVILSIPGGGVLGVILTATTDPVDDSPLHRRAEAAEAGDAVPGMPAEPDVGRSSRHWRPGRRKAPRHTRSVPPSLSPARTGAPTHARQP